MWRLPPHNARTGTKASSTDPATWSSFGITLRAYEQSNGRFAGIGIVLRKENGIVGVDFDNAIEGKSLKPETSRRVKMIGSYSEYSPSGKGIRAFAYGERPSEGRKREDVELYDSARFLTVTGRRLKGSPETIEKRQAEIEALHEEIFPPKEKRARPSRIVSAEPPADDVELLRLAFSAKKGAKIEALYKGEGLSSNLCFCR